MGGLVNRFGRLTRRGSEFDCVIMPVMTQHFKMLVRNLIYTGLTRAKKLGIMIGTRKALAIACHNVDSKNRQTSLKEILNPKLHNQTETNPL